MERRCDSAPAKLLTQAAGAHTISGPPQMRGGTSRHHNHRWTGLITRRLRLLISETERGLTNRTGNLVAEGGGLDGTSKGDSADEERKQRSRLLAAGLGFAFKSVGHACDD